MSNKIEQVQKIIDEIGAILIVLSANDQFVSLSRETQMDIIHLASEKLFEAKNELKKLQFENRNK